MKGGTLCSRSRGRHDSVPSLPSFIVHLSSFIPSHRLTCSTLAGGKPLNEVAEALLYAPMFSL